MKYEKSCGAVIFEGDNVLVLQQRKGHWGFPKGHVENNETEVETAIREIKEETNLDVVIDENYRYVETYSPKEGVTKDVVFFVAKKIGGEVKPQEEEVSQIRWVSPKEALDLVSYESSKVVMRNVIKDLDL